MSSLILSSINVIPNSLSESSSKSIYSLSWYHELTSLTELGKCTFFENYHSLNILLYYLQNINHFFITDFNCLTQKRKKLWPRGGPTGWTFWLAQGEVIGWVRIFFIATDHQMIDLHSKQTVAHYKLLNIVSFFSFNDHGIRATPRVNPL